MNWTKWITGLLLCAGSVLPLRAQFASDIVNGLTNVVLPAVSGNPSYKGYVESDFTLGVGAYRTNFITLATSQGYQFAPWFYMGAGIGVDVLWTSTEAGWGRGWVDQSPELYNHEKTETAVMIPIFTDFRFILGAQTSPGFFINLRLGAAFLCNDSYVQVADGFFTNRSYFYLQPAVGVRIPINRTKPRQAVDIGLHYRLMTADYWAGWQRNAAINGLGLNISYEW